MSSQTVQRPLVAACFCVGLRRNINQLVPQASTARGGARQGRAFRLREVRVGGAAAEAGLGAPAAASLAYVVLDDATARGGDFAAAPLLFAGPGCGGAAPAGEPRWHGPAGGRACGDAAARALDPSMEAALAARLANNIGVALAAAPTSLAADAVALAALAGGPAGCAGGSAAEPGHAPCPGSCAECAHGGGGREASERCACGPECTHARARDRQGAARACGGGAPGVCRSASGAHAPGEGRDGEECGPGAAAMWRARAHAVLAARYRLERKRLLARVASDLRCQAALAR